MEALIKQTVKSLKNRVRTNLKNINDNIKEINSILEEPVSNTRSEKLFHKYEYNKKYRSISKGPSVDAGGCQFFRSRF